MIALSDCFSPNLSDFDGDEEAYNCGVNFYKYGSYEGEEQKHESSDGTVLLGEQYLSIMYYGTAIEDDILIPDVVHIENISVL